MEAAMPHPIFLRIGTQREITLSTFVDSVRDFMRILKDVDATVSEKPIGSVRWIVEALEKRDAAIIGVVPIPRQPAFDRSSMVEAQIIENASLLSTKGERNRFLSDDALQRIGTMANRTPKIGPMRIWVPSNGRPKQETEISPVTLKNVQELTGPKYSGYGSVTGDLESIYVHKGSEFRIWDKQSGKPVRCSFVSDIEQNVKDALRKTVTVTGDMLMNSAGIPLSMRVDELEVAQPRAELVPVQSLSGIIKDFTGGVSLKEYLEESVDE
jgi:hypothetical protein